MPPDGLIRCLHAAYAAPDDGVTDAELLRRCAADADDAAFALLVRRHAGLVWRVCRAVTRDPHAAEDAFQATFLALIRKGAGVGASVPGWLYRVAYRVALKARGRDARRRDVEQEYARNVPTAGEGFNPEQAGVVHDELNRLADKYRLPL